MELELEAKMKGGSWSLKSPSGLQQKEKEKKRERMERREKKKTALVEWSRFSKFVDEHKLPMEERSKRKRRRIIAIVL